MACLDWIRERCSLRVGALVISALVVFWGIVSMALLHKAVLQTGHVDLIGAAGAVFQIIVGALGCYGAWKRYSSLLKFLLYVVIIGFILNVLLSFMSLVAHELQTQRTINEACVQAAASERAHCRHLIWSFRGNDLYDKWATQTTTLLLVWGCFISAVHGLRQSLGQGADGGEMFPTEAQQNSSMGKENMMQHGVLMLSGALLVVGIAGLWVSCKAAEVTLVHLSVIMMVRTACKACLGAIGVYVAWRRSAKLMRNFFWLSTCAFSAEFFIMAAALAYYEVSMQQYVDQVCGSEAGRDQCETGIRQTQSSELFGSLMVKAGIILVFGCCFLSLVHLYWRKLEEVEKKTDTECPTETTPLAPN